MSKYQVGDKIPSDGGIQWVVSAVWEHDTHSDYELINSNTGEHGSLRETTPHQVVQAWRTSLPEDTLLIAQITPADWARLYAAMEGKS